MYLLNIIQMCLNDFELTDLKWFLIKIDILMYYTLIKVVKNVIYFIH